MTGSNDINSHSAKKKRIFLAYYPRAAHHLFMRMFSGHPELGMIEVMEHVDEIVPQTIQLSAKPSLSAVPEDCEALRETWRKCWPKWQNHMQKFESQGKQVLNSFTFAFLISPAEHNAWLNQKLHRSQDTTRAGNDSPESSVYWRLPDSGSSSTASLQQNPTIFPDSFLQDHIPVLLIRHPALAFPSTIRVASQYFEGTGGIGETFMNLILRYRWMVQLHDYYTQESSLSNPLILDADELMYDREAIAELCKELGLDPKNTKYEWAKTKVDVVYAREDIFVDTLAASESIVPGKSSDGVDVEVEMVKWKEEFGVERASQLRRLVDDAMGDYWYLRQRSVGAKMRGKQSS